MPLVQSKISILVQLFVCRVTLASFSLSIKRRKTTKSKWYNFIYFFAEAIGITRSTWYQLMESLVMPDRVALATRLSESGFCVRSVFLALAINDDDVKLSVEVRSPRLCVCVCVRFDRGEVHS